MSAASGREDLVDLVRGLALVGIGCVNIPEMAASHGDLAPSAGGLDRLADGVLMWLLVGKSFPLFAFLLGWGIGRRWEREAPGCFARRHIRRILALAALGLAHGILVYTGDILLPYALVSLLLWPLLLLPTGGRLALAALAIPASMATHFLLGAFLVALGSYYEPSGLAGTFAEATRQRLRDLPDAWLAVGLFNLPLAVGAALAGAAAARAGWPRRFLEDVPWFRPLALALAALALLASLAAGGVLATLGLETAATPWLFLVLAACAAPQCLGYLLLAHRFHARGWRPAWLLASGRNSLTCYVTQGLLAGWVFGSYGLGLFDRLGSAALLGVSLAIVLVAAASAVLWERLIGRGPLDLLLARLTGTRG